jgi:ubiquinone biosynthesis protein
MRRNSLDKARESLRLQQVYNVFLRYGWDVLFDRWETIGDFRRSMQSWVWQIPREELEPVPLPAKMRMMIEELGPTYVKMGQIVSSQASVIPPEWAVELEKLQSNVPPFPSDQVRQIIIEELKAPPEELYATFTADPFAAASTAQVHRATLHDGTAVVVKVQRPYIRTEMKSDIGIMQNAARIVTARSDYVKSIDLAGMLDQFGGSVLTELDYTGEAYNAMRLAKGLEGIPGIRMPEIYPALSTSKVLTMDFIKGVKVSNVEAIQAAGLDCEALGLTVTRAVLKQLLIDGFFHADPHPGNVLVNLQTGDITFIDCGMIGELDVQQRLNLIQLIFAIQSTDVTSMGQILRSMSVPFVEHPDDQGFYHDFDRVVGRLAMTGGDFGQIVSSATNLLSEHGLRLNPNLTMAIKALMQMQAIGGALYPKPGLMDKAVEMIKEMAIQAVTADRIIAEGRKQLLTTAREVFKRVPNLTDATVKWLDQYQKGRFEVTVDTSQLSKEVDKLGGLGQQVVAAIILAGILVGSAIAIVGVASLTPDGNLQALMARLAYIGYLVAMVGGLLMIGRLFWRWFRGRGANED